MAEDPIRPRPDGTVGIDAAGTTVDLRRPTFGELRRFREGACDGSEDRRAAWSSDVLRTLGGIAVEPDALPAWLARPDVAVQLIEHWRGVPDGPWRPAAPGEAAVGPLAGTWFAEFASIYAAFARMGVPPRHVDDMEVWEVAAALGGGTREEPERDLLAERVAAARSGAPPPAPTPGGPPPGIVATRARGGAGGGSHRHA